MAIRDPIDIGEIDGLPPQFKVEGKNCVKEFSRNGGDISTAVARFVIELDGVRLKMIASAYIIEAITHLDDHGMDKIVRMQEIMAKALGREKWEELFASLKGGKDGNVQASDEGEG